MNIDRSWDNMPANVHLDAASSVIVALVQNKLIILDLAASTN